MGNELELARRKKRQQQESQRALKEQQQDQRHSDLPFPSSSHAPYIGRSTTFNNKFSLVICRNSEGKFLAVKETKIRGWWIPGGHVQRNQTFAQAAQRETIEEAGIEVNLKAVIRFEHTIQRNGEERQRMIFYAEPKDERAPLKTIPDRESEYAQWVTIEEMAGFKPLRGPELIEFGRYVEEGGPLLPLSSYVPEIREVPTALQMQEEVRQLWEMQMKRRVVWNQEKIERVGQLVRQGIKYGKYLHELQICRNKILLQIKKSQVPLDMEDIENQARALWEKNYRDQYIRRSKLKKTEQLQQHEGITPTSHGHHGTVTLKQSLGAVLKSQAQWEEMKEGQSQSQLQSRSTVYQMGER